MMAEEAFAMTSISGNPTINQSKDPFAFWKFYSYNLYYYYQWFPILRLGKRFAHKDFLIGIVSSCPKQN